MADLEALLTGSLPPGVRRYTGEWSPWEVAAFAAGAGWQPYVVDLDGVRDKPGFIEAVAHGLDLPAWTGRNWDALEEALGDLPWEGGLPVLVVVGGTGTLAAGDLDAWRTAEAILHDAAVSWTDRGVPVQVLTIP